jgi:hypothetical protein
MRHRARALRIALPIGAVAVGLLIPVNSASAQADPSSERFVDQVSFVWDGSCQDEPVLVTATQRTHIHAVTDATGEHTLWVGPSILSDATGVGLVSGDSYVVVYGGGGAANDQIEDNTWVGTVTIGTFHIRLIRLGAADDYSQSAVAHLTFNANGEITSDFSRVRPECPQL